METIFTLSQANRAIALVGPIVEDVLSKIREAERLHAEVKLEKSAPEGNELSLNAKLSRIEKLLNEVDYHMKELEKVGVYLKDLQLGLVDFPCLHEGRTVFLCWKLGETKVTSWHEADRGFAERKPVDGSFAGLVTAR